MSNDRKNSVWPWIVALLIGLPVLYVASFGPACWLYGTDIMPPATGEWAYGVYAPLVECSKREKHLIARVLWWWSSLGCQEGAMSLWIRQPYVDENGMHR